MAISDCMLFLSVELGHKNHKWSGLLFPHLPHFFLFPLALSRLLSRVSPLLRLHRGFSSLTNSSVPSLGSKKELKNKASIMYIFPLFLRGGHIGDHSEGRQVCSHHHYYSNMPVILSCFFFCCFVFQWLSVVCTCASIYYHNKSVYGISIKIGIKGDDDKQGILNDY